MTINYLKPALLIFKKAKLKIFWINVIIFLNFFPFLKIIPIEAEIQPIAGIVSILYILLYDINVQRRQKMYGAAFPFVATIVAYLSVALALFLSGKLELGFILQSLAIFIAPLGVFLVLIDRMNLISLRMFRWSFYSWFGLTFLQIAMPSLLDAVGISLILKSVTARFAAEGAGMDRGVGAFAPEPSYSAHIILLMFAIAIFLYRKKRIKKNEYLIMLSLSIFMVLANQSTTVGSFFILFGIGYGIWQMIQVKQGRIYFLIGFVLFIVFGTVLVAFFSESLMQIRFFASFVDILGISPGKSANFDIGEISESYGSVRALGVQLGYESLSLTNGFGLGLGGYGPYSVDLAKKSQVGALSPLLFVYGDDSPIRPYSYAAFVSMDLGLMGLVSLSIMFVWLVVMWLKSIKKISPYAFACFLLFFMGVYFNQPTSLPTHWILLLLAFEDGAKKKGSLLKDRQTVLSIVESFNQVIPETEKFEDVLIKTGLKTGLKTGFKGAKASPKTSKLFAAKKRAAIEKSRPMNRENRAEPTGLLDLKESLKELFASKK